MSRLEELEEKLKPLGLTLDKLAYYTEHGELNIEYTEDDDEREEEDYPYTNTIEELKKTWI